MTKYMILIFGDETRWEAIGAEEEAVRDEAHRQFAAKAGPAILAAGQLEASQTSTSLRAGTAGQVAITDGPFLEAKEVLGGFYLVEAEDLDHVIALASGLQEVHAGYSGVEIRPLVSNE
jgi:hypothetical protein